MRSVRRSRRFVPRLQGSVGADQDLTCSVESREPRGSVDRVAQRREVHDIAFPDGADEGCAGMHSGADRDPRLCVVAGLLEEAPCSCDRVGRMVAAGEARNEECHAPSPTNLSTMPSHSSTASAATL
jgi:hypothetical protein